jgi:hypothetical protein
LPVLVAALYIAKVLQRAEEKPCWNAPRPRDI